MAMTASWLDGKCRFSFETEIAKFVKKLGCWSCNFNGSIVLQTRALLAAKLSSAGGAVPKSSNPVTSTSGSSMVRRDIIKLDDSEDNKGPAIQVLNRVPTPPPLIQVSSEIITSVRFHCL